MSLKDMSFEDIARKLNGSMVVYKEDLCKFVEIVYSGRTATITLDKFTNEGLTTERKELAVTASSIEKERFVVTWPFPQVGYVNYGHGAKYLVRKVSRQWKLGYHPKVITILDTFEKEKIELGETTRRHLGGGIATNTSWIYSVYHNNFPSFEEALEQVQANVKQGVAINRYVQIAKSLHFKHIVVAYKNHIVGFVDNNGTIHLYRPAEYVSCVLPNRVVIEDD